MPGLFALTLVTSACSMTAVTSLPSPPLREATWCCNGGDTEISIEYLGVGGWLFRMGESALLTAPFYSNPGFFDTGLGRIESDTAAIERFLPPVEDVSAILVGHAHYDHLMDVPYILRRRAPAARLYGSMTAVNILRGDPGIDPVRLISVEESAGSREGGEPGEWIDLEGGRIRILPLVSGHAPHFFGIELYEGEVDEPATELPARAGGWRKGVPLAWIIDFLSPEGEVIYRVHYQDAASEPPLGFPPESFDGIPVDLAILCPPGYQELSSYPEGVLAELAPRHILLGHWEDFFTPRSEPIRGVRGTDLSGFIERLEGAIPEGARWGMFVPGSVLRIPAPEG